MSLQHTLSRETTVLVYMQKFSEGRGAVAFTAWKMHVERVTVKLKVCLLENKSQNMALQGLAPVVLNWLVRWGGQAARGKKNVSKNQWLTAKRTARLRPDLPWALNSAGTVQPPSLRNAKLMEKVIFVSWDIYIREGKVFCILSLTFARRRGNCNQVSRSQFSQLHIIIWFRYLIHALKLKTCLELTIALVSHRLFCRDIPSACPLTWAWTMHGNL